MKWQVFVAFVVVSAIGGLATTITCQVMIDALNPRRPTDDQIPATFGGVKDMRWALANLPPFWRALKEFHNQFPQNRLYFWGVGSLLWMFVMLVAAALVMILPRWIH
jgi:hypothetical protein